MARTLKEQKREEQNGKSAISGEDLPEEKREYDLHRTPVPKSEGGTYVPDNTVVVLPVEHMKISECYRERLPEHDALKAIVDERVQEMKALISAQNRRDAYLRRKTDFQIQETKDRLEDVFQFFKKGGHMADINRRLEKAVKKLAKKDKLVEAALGIPSVGFVTVAYCTVYIDLTKARHASSLWKYVGLDKPAIERYTVGERSGGNKNLRTALYTMALTQRNNRNKECGAPYGYLYDQVRNRLEHSDKITRCRFGKKDVREVAWKDSKKGHRQGAALRQICKHFLADYWFVGRTILGLPTDPPYPVAVLGKNHRMVMPEERGWVYPGMKVLH